MPKFNPLSVEVAAQNITFVPAQNGATSVWQRNGGTLADNALVTYTRRPVTNSQTTRKIAFGLTIPFSSTCETTCTVTSRGVSLFKLDNVVDTRISLDERTEAYDTFVALLQNSDVRDAVINNGSFYS